ncbi:MAG: sigma-54-dependent Fis family transcriptional regulator [Acidobacteria bacterium]|nr:sigma-54-dependent Fis family transcriptional regulator [Acidobacteriota bacterium]
MACPASPERFVGNDPSLRAMLHTLELVADTDATVLITGETGTGKELIAHTLHARSARCRAPIVAVNCGALTESLLESELFGHVRGAFTGAADSRVGMFEAANAGTLFLDEVADMSLALQSKLLRVLQTGDYTPVGTTVSRRCNVRVVAATNQPLRPLAARGIVRADLYYRLNVVCLDVPPLRARRNDIVPLANHFLAHFASTYGRPRRRLGTAAQRALLAYDFPGNVRELENVMRRMALIVEHDEVSRADLPPEMLDGALETGTEVPPGPERPEGEPHDDDPAVRRAGQGGFHGARARALDRFEHDFLAALLRECGGIVSRAAARAGLSERSVHVKLKKHGLRGRDFRLRA